jgi:hypothetical protein
MLARVVYKVAYWSQLTFNRCNEQEQGLKKISLYRKKCLANYKHSSSLPLGFKEKKKEKRILSSWVSTLVSMST